MRSHYQHFNEEGMVMNTIGVSLIALAILVGYILQRDDFRYRAHILIRSGDLDAYPEWREEGIVINALGISFIALAILVSFAVRSNNLKSDFKVTVVERM
ncbi:hypothetical protein HUJ04_000330 [Dendroctonus ponderosae]|nr:hypothetical protein HUJ04_000330 [Dendroctonus ponderosae]